MSVDPVYALAFGVALGSSLAASILWVHSRRTRRRLEDVDVRLRRSEARLQVLLRDARDLVAVLDGKGRITYANPASERLFRRRVRPLLGSNPLSFLHPEDRDRSLSMFFECIQRPGKTERIEVRAQHENGSWRTLEVQGRNLLGDPAIEGFVLTCHDVTEVRARAELLAHQAIHDPLTGLPNRVLFIDRLRSSLAETADDEQVAVLFVNLDHFNSVNASHGHPAGDRLLVALADRMRSTIRPSDTVARFGGDEFAVLCRAVPDEAAAQELARQVADSVSRSISLSEGEIFVTASIGIALSDDELETPETLLRNAEAAMCRAKDRGRARSELFRSDALNGAVRHLRTGNELHRALERDELRMHYQPIMNLETGRICGFEALLRWEHPMRGLVGPNEFAGLAEETGLDVPIGLWTLEQSCRQAELWHSHGSQVTMSVNISPRQIGEPGLPDDVARVLHATRVRPELVWLEITETALMRDAESAVRALTALRSLGVHLAVDDFGTGYSSMTYLKRFPVEALKVDRTFVDGLGREPEDSAICTAVVRLAHSLGLRAVAEGVETPEQLAELRTLGCELAQGYLFGHAAPPETFGDRPDEQQWVALSGS